MVKLSLDGISKYYQQNLILKDINFSFDSSKVYALVGRNGSGKTTLVNIMTGVSKPTCGSIWLQANGEEFINLCECDMPVIYNLGVFRNFQTPRLFNNLTVKEFIIYLCKKQINYVESFIDASINCLIKDLSMYQQKALETFIIKQTLPRIIILDEFSSGLTNEEADRLLSYLFDQNEMVNSIIILVEHKTYVVNKFCQHVIKIENGRVIEGD